ncbi:MAG: PQQ-binding-like beta-propeller repeat protein [Thermoguttaceae bacterium]
MKNITKCLAPVVVSLIISGDCLLAQDWPQWRGPDRDGKVTGFSTPSTWPTNFTQRWHVIVGKGDASPVLAGENLYVFSRQETDEVVLCLEATSGKTLWEARYPAGRVVTGVAAGHPGPRSTPVIAEGKICTLGIGGVLSCFDAANGTVLWRKQSTNDYLGASTKSDSAMSPIVVDGYCIVHVGEKNNGAVIAFELAGGMPKWKWNGDGPANSSPVVMTVGGGKQLVTLTAKNLVGLALADGKLLWQVPFEAAQGNNATPVVDGSILVCTGQGKGMFAVKIEPQGESFTATPLWTNKQLSTKMTTPVLKEGLLYGYNGSLFCASAQTGELLWKDAAKRGMNAAMLDAGSVILVLTLDGELTAFRPSNTAYTELARIKVADTEAWAHPVVAGNKVFVKEAEAVSLWTIDQ